MNDKYILFGTGEYCRSAIKIIDKKNIEYFVDNDIEKKDTTLEGIPIFHFIDKKEVLKEAKIVIAVSEKYYKDIEQQLEKCGCTNIWSFSEVKSAITQERISKSINNITIYNKAIDWIKQNTLDEGGIICNTGLKMGYPEVTGYYIPTLIRWGYRDIAIKYVDWLLEIQKEDGSWYDTRGSAPYIFDSAQILKGLIAARLLFKDTNKVDQAIIKGCDWILSRMDENGRLVTPDTQYWGNDENICSEIIHLYCLSPIKEAGIIFGKKAYIDAVDRILKYYKSTYYEKIMNFSLLSHFYAYVMEALLDLGCVDMCRDAMAKIADLQKPSGAVPAYNNVDWVCSTGLFQLSLVWFRLGDINRGNAAFEYACKLQNESGGWFGSYLSEDNSNEENHYFPNAEISWANKYFLDALYYKNKAEMDLWASRFKDRIPLNDERYLVVKEHMKNSNLKVLDVGCGKGRYLRNLKIELPNNEYFGTDISSEVLKYVDDVEVSEGVLTNIPYDNELFDVVYTCGALEHAVDIDSALRELFRVTKENGSVIIIDKNDICLGALNTTEWEQWFNEEELKNKMLKYCSDVEIRHGLKYENMNEPGLFSAWVGRKRTNA